MGELQKRSESYCMIVYKWKQYSENTERLLAGGKSMVDFAGIQRFEKPR